MRGVRGARGAAATAAAPRLEQDLGERAVVVDRRRAVAERLQADMVGAGVEVRLDDLGDLLRVPCGITASIRRSLPPSAMSASVKP